MHRKNAQFDEMQRQLQAKNGELQNETTNSRFSGAFNPPPPPQKKKKKKKKKPGALSSTPIAYSNCKKSHLVLG